MSKLNKSLICLFLCLAVIIPIFGCNTSTDEESNKTQTTIPTSQVTQQPTKDPGVEPTLETSTGPTVTPTAEPTAEPTVEPTDSTTAEATEEFTTPTTSKPTTAKPTTAKPTATPAKDIIVDVSSLAAARDYTAAQFTEKILLIHKTEGISMGSYNLSQISSIILSYGADPNADISSDKVYILDDSGNEIASDYLESSNGAFWAQGLRDIKLDINSTYSGELFITKDTIGNNIAISKIILVAKNGSSITTPKPTTIPTATAKPTAAAGDYNALVKKILEEAQKVTDFMRAQKFKYGDAKINPAYNWGALDVNSAINPNEKIVSCDRLVDWILFRAGFTVQMFNQGMTVGNLDEWCEEYGFTKITNVNKLQAGDIVFVNPHPGGWAKHVFLCASSKGSDGKYLRYDAGSDTRITGITGTEVTRGKQPFRETISQFMYAYRPNTSRMPVNNASIYVKPSTTVAVPKTNAKEVFTKADYSWNGGVAAYNLEYKYEPGKTYKQYELHVTVKSSPSSSDTNYWNACYIGARIPDTAKNMPYGEMGGVWVAFTSNKASVYFGNPSSWPVRETSVDLPVSISTAQKIVVVDSGDVIKYYHVTSSGIRTLLLSITLDEESSQSLVWDGNNKYLLMSSTKFSKSGYFNTFAHFASATVSDISIKVAD